MSDHEMSGPKDLEVEEGLSQPPSLAMAAPRELTAEEQQKLAELDEALQKFESQKRWSDVIRTILAKAEIVVDPMDKIALYAEAGTMYIERSSNQAEAIKCFEHVLEIDPHNVDAIVRLKDMYEKRRDWERLIKVMQAESMLMSPEDRLIRVMEMAQLATERLRKPEICIDLWRKVLDDDAENPDALANLSQLYERAREWGPLAAVLEKVVEGVSDANELKQQLQKLGMIYADKLGDDAGAVRAFKRLLTLDPDDRRAQEQLKRRYVSLKAWDDLEEFYQQTEKWDELIRVLEREAENKDAPEGDRIDLLFRAARLWMTTQGKTDRAARAYEKILEMDPENLGAAEALSPIYEQANDARKLAGVYEVRLKHLTDPTERIQLLRETGLLYEERLRDAPSAFEKFLEAFGVDPSQEVIREDVDRLAGQVDGWSRVIAAYQSAIEEAPDPTELRMSFGKVLKQVDRIDDAIAQYRAVYDVAPDHHEAITALAELYRQTERYRDMLEIYERRIELETDPDKRRQMAYGKASLLESELNAPNEAIDAYRTILAEYGDGEQDAYRSLDRLYEQQGRWNDFAATLQRRIDLAESHEEMAALKYRLARAFEQHLELKAEAVELYREVLTILPEHDGGRMALEALLDDAEVGVPAARILEPIYEVRADWPNLIRALTVLHDGTEDADEQLELLTKIGYVQSEQIGDQSASFEAFCRALRAAPHSEDTLARLEFLASEQDKFPDLVALLGELAGGIEDPVLARTLWMKAARIDTQLGNVDGAVAAYKQVLALDPGDLEVLGELEMLYRTTERWRDLLGVLRRRAELAGEPDDKELLLAQIAAIHDQMLEEPAEAISVYQEILELDPSSQRALGELDSLFARQEMWSDLADNLDRQLQMAGDPEREIDLMLRIAQLRETRMGAVDAAIEIYREVLDRDPQNQAALASLERLIDLADHQLVIAEILEPIYQNASEFQKLIAVHEIQAKHASSPERRVDLLHRVADLYEMALDQPEAAFQVYARALGEDPSNTTSQEHLERLARAFGGAEALAQVFEEQVQHVEDPQLLANLYVKAAQIREEQLGDAPNAIKHYQKVLEIDSEHLEAASALERLFQITERYEDLANIYLTKAKMLSEIEAQKEYFFRAAAIYEEILERPLDAVEVYRQALELDAEEVRALDKLIELYLRLEKWTELLEVYTKKADIVFDPEEKKRLYTEVGAVFEREVGDTEKAIDTYQRILEIDPDDLTALGRLDALYQATENWQELLSVLERQADLAGDPSEAISYRYRTGELWHRRLGDATRAIDIYREILDVVPDHEPTLNALEAMVSENMEPVAAAGVLEPVYKQFGEFSKLITVHEVQIAHEDDPVRKVELLHQVAQLYEFQLDQAQQALAAYARALPLDNQNEDTLGSLERLGEHLNAWQDVTRLYDVEIEKLEADNPDVLVEMALRTAQLYEVQVGDTDAAIVRYQKVVDTDAMHVQAIEALDRLYESTERWNELASILEKEIQVAGSPDEALNFQFRLGQVYQTHLNDVDKAIEQYRQILEAAPDHSQSLSALELLFADGIRPLAIGEVLEPLYRMQEAWDRLLNVRETQLQYQDDAAERVAMMHQIAEIAEDKAGDHGRAFVWMQRALLEEPLHDHSGSEVERLAQMLDGWQQLASTYADVLESSQDPEARKVVGKRLARVFEQELGDVQRAEEAYRFVLTADAEEAETLEALDRIYDEHGSHEALAEVLRKRIAITQNNDDLVQLYYRLGRVLENDLGRTDEAITAYNHLLSELDSQHMDTIRALEDVYTRLEDWPNLFATFEKEMEVALGDAAQSEVIAKMARIASDRLGDFEKAIETWKKVLDIRGEDIEALNAIGDIYATQENWRDLVDILEREVSITEDDQHRIAIYSDLGRIWYEKLGRDRNALDSWERVLDIDPSNTEALFHIAEIHRAANQWVELVDTLHRVVDVGAATLDDRQIENVYMQLGFIYATELQQPMDAVDAYRKVVDVDPRHFEALDALEHIHREEGQWEDAIQVMEQRVDAFDDEQQKITGLLTIARAWEEQVGDADKGTSAYQRILSTEPLHEYAFVQLEHLHAAARRWEDLIEMYLGRLDVTEDTDLRIGLLGKIANVYEKELDEKGQAFDAMQIAWTEDFKNKKTAAEVERLAAAANKWNELLTGANEALAAADDPEIKIAICLQCAKWYGEHLGRHDYAIPYIRQILALEPTNVSAVRQMAKLYELTQQWQLLAQTLGTVVEMATDPLDKALTFVQMGQLCEEQLGIPQQSEGYYQKAIDAVPTHVPALEALERIYRERGEWVDMLEMLKRKADALESPEDILEARLQIAETYEDRLNQADDAIQAYRRVLEQDGRNLQALKGLERLYAQAERWQELLQVLEAQYDVVATEKERITILTRLASMWEEEFVKPEKAAERLEQVLEIDTAHEGALTGLERIYRNMQRWDQLIGTYERHVSSTPDRGEKVRIYKAIGEVYAAELHDQDRAVDAYLNVVSINEDDVEALDALARLYEKRGEHSSALEMMDQLARLLGDPQQVVELRYRMGRILDEQLGDRMTAVENYQRALDVEPGHLPSLEAMRRIHVDSGDWLAASRVLEQETQYQESPRLKAKLYAELGQIYEQRLDEHDRAIECFEQAYKNDQDNEDAALPLAYEYVQAERWQEAFPLLEMLVKRSGKRDADEQHRLAFMLGDAASRLGEHEEAIKAFAKAYQLDSTHLPSLLGLAAAYYATKDWEKAFKYYQMLLVHHRDSLAKDQITDIFYRLGVIKREQGERRKALNMFDKALEEDSHHRLTLEAVVGLYETQKEWEQVIHFKKVILEVADTDDERFKLLEEIGDLWKEKVNNVPKAIQAYADASDIRPEDHKVLHKLLGAFQETKQWEKAIDIIERVSGLDPRASVKSKYAYTVAVIIRDELKDSDRAVDKFNESLDHDPGQLKAFEAINKILTQKKDWKGLERAFRKMLHRIIGKEGTDPNFEFSLWHNLGLIYRDRQKNLEASVEAFRMASQRQPDNALEHQILAELFSVLPGRIDDAIAEHQWLLRQDPYRVDSYRALYKLYFDARAYDKAWCLAATLTFLQKADAEQQQFYQQYRQQGIIRPQSRVDNERWVKDLFHPDEDLYVGKMMEALAPAVHALKASTDKALRLQKKYEVDPASSTVTFARTFGFVAQVLNLPIAPRLFLRSDAQGGLAHVPGSNPPAVVCGASLLSGFSPQDLAFVLGRYLSYYRPEHFMRTMLATSAEMKVILLAGIRLAGLGPADPQVDATAQQLAAKLGPTQIEALRNVGKKFAEAGARTDVKKWMQTVELSGCRAGFLLANDLETAARMIQALPPEGPTDLPPKEKIKEVVLFSVSESYFRLREALGIQIKV